MYQLLPFVSAATLFLHLFALSAHGETKTWTPQGFSKDWHDPANWTPMGVPGGLDDVIHSNGLRSISLINGPSSGVDNIHISGGARLFTDGYTLTVNESNNNGIAHIEGSGSELIVHPGEFPTNGAYLDSLELTTSGNLNMAGGTVRLDRSMSVDSQSRITGHGRITFLDQDVNNPPEVLSFSGTFLPSGGTLVLEADENAEATFSNSHMNASFGDLAINAKQSGFYDGIVTVGANHLVSYDQPFIFDSSAILNLLGGAIDEPAIFRSPDVQVNNRINVNGFSVMTGKTYLNRSSSISLPDPNDTLQLQGASLVTGDIIDEEETGATFTGTGKLVNGAFADMILLNNPIIDVHIENSGTIDLFLAALFFTSEVGFTTFDSFRQTVTGTLNFDIGIIGGEVAADAYSVVNVAEIDGALEVDLVDIQNAGLPMLSVGDNFTILTALGGITGEFSSTKFPTPPSGTSWSLHYGATSVILELIAGLPGDYNDDGIVDTADYTVWLQHLGGTTVLPGDSTPGTVTQEDYLVWKNNFGNSSSTTSLAANVPEPSGIVLTLLVAAGLMPTRQRKGFWWHISSPNKHARQDSNLRPTD